MKKILTFAEIKKLATVPRTNYISAMKVVQLNRQNRRLQKKEVK